MYNVYAQTNSSQAGAQLILDYQWHLSAQERRGNSTLGEIFVYSPVRSRSGKQCKISPIQNFNVVSSLRCVGLMPLFLLFSSFLFYDLLLNFAIITLSMIIRRARSKRRGDCFSPGIAFRIYSFAISLLPFILSVSTAGERGASQRLHISRGEGEASPQ